MANEAVPYYEPGQDLTGKAIGAAVTGKRCLKINGNQIAGAEHGGALSVAHADAGGRICGVADRDAAQNKLCGILRGPGRVVPIRAEAAIAFFEEVKVGTGGQVIPLGASDRDLAIGYAITAALINTDAKICLY